MPPGEIDLGTLQLSLNDDFGGDGVRKRVRKDVEEPSLGRDGEVQHDGTPSVIKDDSSGGKLPHTFSSSFRLQSTLLWQFLRLVAADPRLIVMVFSCCEVSF